MSFRRSRGLRLGLVGGHFQTEPEPVVTSGVQYALARQGQRRWRRYMEQVFDRYDALLAPTCGMGAPLIEESDGVETTRLLTRFTYSLNLAALPVLSIPCGFTAEGLPISLQIAARQWQETLVLRAAWAYQQATDWHLRRPIQ